MTLLGALSTAAGLLLVAIAAHAVVRHCALRNRAEAFVAGLVVAAAELVLIAELLSLAHGFARGWGLFALLLWCAGAVVISRRVRPYAGFAPGRRTRAALDWAAELWRELDTSRIVVLAAALLAVILLVEFAQSVIVAPNDRDSLAYHLARAAYWMQFHTIAQFTNATPREAAFPVNAEVIQAWAMMLARGDRTVQLVQWLAGLGLIATVYALARRIGARRRDAFMAMTVAASLPTVIGEATSAQNDLVFAFFALAIVLFAAAAIRERSAPAGLLAGAAFGLAVGTKTVALPMVPAFAAFALVLCGREWRLLVRPALAAAAALLLLGSFNYAQNLAEHHSLTATPQFDSLRVASPREVPANAVRIAWLGLVDMPALTIKPVDDAVSTVGDALFGGARIENTQYTDFFPQVSHIARADRAGLGLLGLFVLLPALILALARPRERERFALAIFAVAGFVMVVVSLRYNVWITRFLMPSYVAAAPLTYVFFSRRWTRAAILLLMVVSALPMLLLNESKSLAAPNVLGQSRAEQMSGGYFDTADVFPDLARRLPESGRVGFVGYADSPEYEVFGPHFDRTIVKLTAADVKPGVMERYDLDALVVLDSTAAARALAIGGSYLGRLVGGRPVGAPEVLVLRRPGG